MSLLIHLPLLTIAALTLLTVPVSAAAELEMEATPETMWLLVAQNDLGYTLQISGPDGYTSQGQFSMAEQPYIDLFDAEGSRLADGQYRWELRSLVAESRRRAGADEAQRRDRDSAAHFTGGFTIENGEFVDPHLSEEPATKQVISEDLSVVGRQCIGLRCTETEDFGGDLLRLKDSRMRLKFEDTSGGSYPGNDWQLAINDLENGGRNRFSIEDSTAQTAPFTLHAGAPDDALVISPDGTVGIGTSTPSDQAQLHIIDGDTVTLRLEQDGSAGFEPKSWDIGANEANFFIREVGGSLPLRVRAGAPVNSLYVHNNGRVGLRTDTPSAELDVNGSIAVAGTVDGRDLAVDGAQLDAHLADFENPHEVTAEQVGADPAGTAAALIAAHEAAYPHEAQASQFGLVPSTVFTGGSNGREATVTFATPFPTGTEYVVLLTATSTSAAFQYTATAFEKSEDGFKIALGEPAANLVDVSWMVRPVTN